jgi:uncharacterized protein YndB with AHSA1/START domain
MLLKGSPMSDIVQELTIEATPENVFYAITLPDRITEWWANHVAAEPMAGSLAEIRFDNGEVMKIEITELEVGKKVHWRVRLAPHNWEGSTITWDLMPVSKGTRLLFGHHDLVVGNTAYSTEQTRTGWEYFLGSLKSYLETGKGTPYVHHMFTDPILLALVQKYPQPTWQNRTEYLFEDLVGVIISQQLSRKAADTIIKKFKQLFFCLNGKLHSRS